MEEGVGAVLGAKGREMRERFERGPDGREISEGSEGLVEGRAVVVLQLVGRSDEVRFDRRRKERERARGNVRRTS